MPTAIDAAAANPAVAPPASGAAEAPAPGFAEALQAQQGGQAANGTSTSAGASEPAGAATSPFDPRALPTVALGTMLASFAGAPADPLPAVGGGNGGPGAVDGVAAAGTLASSGASGAGAAVLQAGEQYLGVPYLWGGTDPDVGLDCSGFVQQVFGDLGVSLPRVSIDQSRAGVEVPAGMDAAQPGDLLFWKGTGGRPNHIAIYAGNGQMLDAPRSGEVVGYRDITRGAPDNVRRVTGTS